jgi:tetratricopeptide (TPR) repeat protein
LALANQGETDAAAGHYAKALQLQPETDQLPALPDRLAMNFAEAGRFPEAVGFAEKALALARKTGNDELARAIQTRLETYQSQR